MECQSFGRGLAIAVAFGVLSALTAEATEWYWCGEGADAKWTTLKNWRNRSGGANPTVVPGAGDSLWVSRDVPLPLNLSDADSVDVLNAVDSLHITESASKFNVTAPEGTDVSISTPIFGGSAASSGSASYGEMTVTGPGTLRQNSAYLQGCYMKRLTLDGATLWLPQIQEGSFTSNQYALGVVCVTNGATLHLPAKHNGQWNTGNNYVTSLNLLGDGTVTSEDNCELRFSGSGGTFAGVLTDKIRIFMSGKQYLIGANSTMNWTYPRVYNGKNKWAASTTGVMGVKRFGMTGQPSSIGKIGTFSYEVDAGTYLYLGEGEITDKIFKPYLNGSGVSVLDAGKVGGLQFVTNGGVVVEGTLKWNGLVGLSGSNTTACVFRGKYNEVNGSYLLTTVKKGPGTWKFADPAKDGLKVSDYRNFRGSISVDEGVLQFDTIAPVGVYCSVGLATMLKPAVLGEKENLPDVDWAFSLGGTNSLLKGLAEGTLEYTGTNAVRCVDRRVRLEADGRLRANGPKKIVYRLAESTSARAKTLSLDGSSAATNEVHDIVDTETHPVSVVKEGAGTWLVGGDKAFHGDLTVRGGKLIVTERETNSPYSWFRYTIKNLFDPVNPDAVKSSVSVRFLGLFDQDGACQTLNTLESDDDAQASTVEPGEACYATTRKHIKGVYSSAADTPNNDNVTNLFHRVNVFDVKMYNKTGTAISYPRLDMPESYLPIVVRLRDNANAIASYDWATTYGWTSGNKGGFHWMPCQWSLEGSVDGVHWEDANPDGGDYVITTNDYPAVAYDGYFVKANASYSQGSAAKGPNSPINHTGGWDIRGTTTNDFAVLKNVGVVEVASGATLEIVNAQSAIDQLKVDAANGAGTIKGAKFAASGTLDLVGYTKSMTSVPLTLTDVPTSANLADWSVKIDGTPRPAYGVEYANGELKIIKPGTLLIFR